MEYLLVAATYLLFPLIGISLWKRFTNVSFFGLNVIIFGLSPILIARIVSLIIFLFPGIHYSKIQWIVLACCGLGVFFIRVSSKFQLQQALNPVFFIALIIAILSITAPFYGNDPLKYAMLSKMFFREMSFASYPMTGSDPQTGFYVITSHPIGYTALLLWSYIMQGSAAYMGVGRFIAPFYCVLTTLLIARTLTKFGFISATLGMLVLLLAPGYTYGVFIHHLDALRVFLFFAAIILCCEYVKQSSKSLFILATITAGMTLWSHSSGILLLLFYPLLALLLSSGESRYKILVKVLAILFFALIIGGDQYLSNLLRYGSPVFDQALIPPKFQSDYGMYLSQSYGFTDLASRIFKGALVEFYSVNQFGYVFWLLIPILLMKEFTSWRHKDYEDNLSHASSILIGTFIVMAIVSSLCGIEFFINSYRYSLILLPFAAYAVSTTNRVGLSVICLLVVLASAQGTVTQIEKYWHYAQTWKISDFSDEQSHTAKEGFLSGDLLDVAQKETSNTAKFLIFRPMEFWYYANRFGVRHTDPSLTSVYQANDVGSAYRALTELGISHVYSDKLRDPLYTMSELSSILDDPKYVSIISENNGYRILQLNNRENSSESSVAQEPTYSTGSQWISISFSNLPAATESRYMTIGCTVSAPSFVETYATEENANGEAIRTYRLARTFLNDHELNLKFMLNLSHVVTNVRLDFRGVLIDNTPSVHGCSAKIEF